MKSSPILLFSLLLLSGGIHLACAMEDTIDTRSEDQEAIPLQQVDAPNQREDHNQDTAEGSQLFGPIIEENHEAIPLHPIDTPNQREDHNQDANEGLQLPDPLIEEDHEAIILARYLSLCELFEKYWYPSTPIECLK